MVIYEVIVFFAQELESAGTLEPETYTQNYRTTKERLEDCLKDINRDRKMILSQLRHILAVLFILAYIDVLTKTYPKSMRISEKVSMHCKWPTLIRSG